MSISKVFYTLIEDKSVAFKSAEFQSDHVIFRGQLRHNAKRCSCCKSSVVQIRESKERTFRLLNLGQKRAYLKIDTHKLLCQKCGAKGWIQLPFTSGKFPLTNAFIWYVIQLMSMTTLLCVALFLGLQWRTVKSIDKANLSKRAKQFSFKKLRYISIDEIAIKKGHKYMTIFTDISTGQIIHAVVGRSEEVLRPFLKLLSNDKIRRAEYEKHHSEGKKVLKGQRFLLLRNFVDLDDGQKSSLQHLLEINQSLAIAHSMKEQFRLFWALETKAAGARFLGWWIVQAIESGVVQLARTA